MVALTISRVQGLGPCRDLSRSPGATGQESTERPLGGEAQGGGTGRQEDQREGADASEVEVAGDRQLTLLKGQIYLEVAPLEGAAKFVVKAGNREMTATGTHFAVQADPIAPGVVVTQGKNEWPALVIAKKCARAWQPFLAEHALT